MSQKKTSNINRPFDPKRPATSRIICPKCGNDGSDGSITGKSVQYGLIRICSKCKYRWAGGFGVQRADFSNPLPKPNEEIVEDEPSTSPAPPSFRDPSKNFDH